MNLILCNDFLAESVSAIVPPCVGEEAMAELSDDIAAYDAMRADLESEALGKWVLVRNRCLEGTFGTFDEAARDAVHRFGRGPYLIRQVGAGSVTLPASVVYRPTDANHKMRI